MTGYFILYWPPLKILRRKTRILSLWRQEMTYFRSLQKYKAGRQGDLEQHADRDNDRLAGHRAG